MTYSISRNKSISFRCIVVFHILSNLPGFTNGHNTSLGSQDGRHLISAAKIANWWDTESSIIEVSLSELATFGFISQLNNFFIDLKNALILHSLDIWHGQPIFWVYSYWDIVVLLNHIFFYVAISICFRVHLCVDYRIFFHCEWYGFNKEW